jgi:ribosomal protein S18 acetylase RimI-like enzyme
MTPSIELAAPTDMPRLLEIRYAAFAGQAPSAYSPKQVTTLLADVDEAELRSMIEEEQLFVARLDQQIAGLAGWRDDRLRHVYVWPAYARRGLATALVRQAERDFRARTGRPVIEAGVALHAEPFYRAIGYTVVRRATAWDGSGYLEMTRPLDQ